MKNQKQILRRKTFSQFVHQLYTDSIWKCCDKIFQEKKEIDIHVSKEHMKEIEEKVELIIESNTQQNQDKPTKTKEALTKHLYLSFDLQDEQDFICKCKKQKFIVILFYNYVQIDKNDLEGLCLWQVNIFLSNISFF